jgi:hypothetical protein
MKTRRRHSFVRTRFFRDFSPSIPPRDLIFGPNLMPPEFSHGLDPDRAKRLAKRWISITPRVVLGPAIGHIGEGPERGAPVTTPVTTPMTPEAPCFSPCKT